MTTSTEQTTNQISTGKKVVSALLNDAFYSIPYFQRHYQWNETHIENLLADIEYAAKFGTVNQSYFLGAFVLQETAEQDLLITYQVIDGQQRLITLLLIVGVLRDLIGNEADKQYCQQIIYPTSSAYPEGKARIYFENREAANLLIKQLSLSNSTKDENYLSVISSLEQNPSFANMAHALLVIHRYFKQRNLLDLSLLYYFLLNKVFVIYMATDNFTDAFRLFSVLNDRGLPLSATDVIKSRILADIKQKEEREKYARVWSQAESDIGLERLKSVLEYFRMIVLKERPKNTIIRDFERSIYKEDTGVKRGKDVMEKIKTYIDIYRDFYYQPTDFFKENAPALVGYMNVMKYGLAEEEWLPVVMAWYDKFGRDSIFLFLQLLDKKLAVDWMSGVSRYERAQFSYNLLKGIHDFDQAEVILNDKQLFKIDISALEKALRDNIYGKLYTKYVLLKLEYLARDNDNPFNDFEEVTVDHILPQNPYEWSSVFGEEDHKQWIHKLGNLTLVNRKEDYLLRSKSFEEKKQSYYADSESVYPRMKNILYHPTWTISSISERQEKLVTELLRHFAGGMEY